MKISIEAFLESGKFGPLDIGSSKDKAISILGNPDSNTDIGENGSILQYAWYELFFDNEYRLYSIQNDNYDPKDIATYSFRNENIEIDYWFLNEVENQSIGDIANLLDTKGMVYEIIDYYGRDVIKLASGVVVDFDEEVNEYGVRSLIGIRYWP